MIPVLALEDSEHLSSSSVSAPAVEVGVADVEVVMPEAIAIHRDREMLKGVFESEQCNCKISYAHIRFVQNC